MENGQGPLKVLQRVPKPLRQTLPRNLMADVQCPLLSPFLSQQLRSQTNPRAVQPEEAVQVQTQADFTQKNRWGKKGGGSATEKTGPRGGAGKKKASHENVLFYLWKINSACSFIILPFLETLSSIKAANAWEATKCSFLENLLLSVNIRISGQPRFPFPFP